MELRTLEELRGVRRSRTRITRHEVPAMRSILITDCLQQDFVGPVDRFEGLPNALHVGHDESLRLLGPNAGQGPVARMLAWAHQQPDDHLTVVHVRDWHDPANPAQREHLAQFGAHCVAGSPGAAFVFPLDDAAPGKRLRIVDATTLTNFHDTNLGEHLDPLAAGPVRVGLMGVWTEAKITFLAYDLRARYPHFQLAVCSALTASSSRENHFLALDQMERILGVRVIDSVSEFVDFLGGKLEDAPLIGFSEKHPVLKLGEGTVLADTDRELVRYLFRGCREVSVRSLDGGFSGNAVLGARSIDLHGHDESPHVVKVGAAGPIGQERTSFERIEAVLGNSAPRIVDFADLRGRGALKYRYAAIGRAPARSFQKLYEDGLAQERVDRVLEEVFGDQLGRLYLAAQAERCDLLQYYDFDPKWSGSVRRKLVDLLGEAGAQPELEFPGGVRVPSILGFYEHDLAQLPRVPRAHYFAHVHGDLNGANVLLDEPGNVWLIDFFHAHRGHVLRDLVKFENDLLYIWTKLDGEAELAGAMRLTDWLLAARDLGREPAADSVPDFAHPQLARVAATILKLRSFYPSLIQADREITQLLIPQIRYAVHTLAFEESNAWQKRWALYTACRAAELLKRLMQHAGPLRVDWMPAQYTGRGRLGLTIVPGRRDYERSLDADLRTLKREGVNAVVCLLANDEFERYGVADLLARYRGEGMDVLHLPTIDRTPPSAEAIAESMAWIAPRLEAGKRVLVHCVGGLGRAGTIAACWLRGQGLDGDEAIRAVRAFRSPRAIETAAQEQAIRSRG
jgi:protein-tyrosine phosphatase/nicotinamidase-related amidase